MAQQNPTKVGVLFKRSDYLKEWKPRHFVLTPPQLRYCLPESPNRVHKSLDLTMCKIARNDGVVHWGGSVFHTLVVSKPGAGVSYTLGALRAEDAEAWVAALKVAAGDATRNYMRNFQQKEQVVPGTAPPEPAAVEAPTRDVSSLVIARSANQLQQIQSRQDAPLHNTTPPEMEPAPARARPRPHVAPRPAAPLIPSLQRQLSPEANASTESALPHTTFVAFLLPSVCYAALRTAPDPLYNLRGLAFLLSLAILLWRRDQFTANLFKRD